MRFTLLAATLFAVTTALVPIQIKGNRFIRPGLDSSQSDTVFEIVGVDYQPNGSSGYSPDSGVDALTDEQACLRDAYVFQQLGINTIRIYTISPWLNHDACMSIFNAAGIYVVLDVSSPLGGESIARYDPESTYNKNLLNRIWGVVDAFKGYPNVLGFFAGNEVVNDPMSAQVSPQYVRAVIRDLKDYVALHADRPIPVGYSAADDIALRAAMWEYTECDSGDNSRADFYALNSYQWCSGRDNWMTSGYNALLSTFKNTAIPLFLSEYGCNLNSPRTFTEVNGGIYNPDGLIQAFSGGMVYEYSQEANNYGLVDIQADGSVKLLADFDNLKAAFSKINLPVTPASSVPASVYPKCDSTVQSAISALDSNFNTDFNIPGCPEPDLLRSGIGNNNIGKIIDVTSTMSKFAIYDSSGKQIENPSININSANLLSGGNPQPIAAPPPVAASPAPVSSSSLEVPSSSAIPSSASSSTALASSTSLETISSSTLTLETISSSLIPSTSVVLPQPSVVPSPVASIVSVEPSSTPSSTSSTALPSSIVPASSAEAPAPSAEVPAPAPAPAPVPAPAPSVEAPMPASPLPPAVVMPEPASSASQPSSVAPVVTPETTSSMVTITAPSSVPPQPTTEMITPSSDPRAMEPVLSVPAPAPVPSSSDKPAPTPAPAPAPAPSSAAPESKPIMTSSNNNTLSIVYTPTPAVPVPNPSTAIFTILPIYANTTLVTSVSTPPAVPSPANETSSWSAVPPTPGMEGPTYVVPQGSGFQYKVPTWGFALGVLIALLF